MQERPQGHASLLAGVDTARAAVGGEDWAAALAAVLSEPGAIAIACQPIVDLSRGTVVGYEALARFTGPPAAPPDRWFAEARRQGLGASVNGVAVGAALALRPSLPPNCFLAINVDPNLLAAAPVREAFEAVDHLAGVIVELTEHAEVEDYDDLRSVLATYRARGATIAVDDAGMGYASLRHILAVRPQLVKLDRALGTFASRTDAWIVAEGIERREELDALVRIGVPLGQGYLLGRPSPPFAELEPALGVHIRGRIEAKRSSSAVAPLLERARSVSTWTGARPPPLFEAQPALDVVPVLDAWERPIGLVQRAREAGGRRKDDVMRVKATSQVADVARRAMTRPLVDRFDPLLCCDDLGRYIGVVRVERLVERLAQSL